MARDYAKVSARFWTGETGRQLRGLGAEAQVVALYLVTCPSSNMVGLYYLPIPTLVHETGLTREGAWKALRSLGEVGFAHYDDAQEVVWVPEMACHQVGAGLQPNDNQVKGVVKAAAEYRKCRFYRDFLDRYRDAYHIKEAPKPEGPPKGTRTLSEGPSEALRSQEQEQEQEQEKAAAARARARDGAISKTGPGVAEAASPPPAAEAAPGPNPYPKAPLAAPALPVTADAAPTGEAPPKQAEQASTSGSRPELVDDDVPRRPLRLVDTSDLGPLGAEWRCDLERASGWKIVLGAVGRREQVRKDLEAACEALGLERAVAAGVQVAERRKSQGLGPPGSWAFFVPALQEAIAGQELMPEPVRVKRFEPRPSGQKPSAGPELFTLERWQPLLAQLPPAGVEQLVAERDRLVAAVEGEGLWNSARNAKLFEVEEYLWAKWSGRAAAGGG